jgi:phosphoribosylanthranilate isomerase
MSKVKICGNFLDQDLKIIKKYQHDIDCIGFIFTRVSKRYVTPEQVAEWMKRYPFLREKAVGVFLNQSVEEIEAASALIGLKTVQLHGDEPPYVCQELRKRTKVKVWKVIAVDENGIQDIDPYLPFIDALLLDTKVKGQTGGTGQTFDWKVIPTVLERTEKQNIPLWIAGGITPENVQELLSFSPIQGIDLASGVEGEKGKDLIKVQSLLEGVRKHANSGQ